MDRRRSYVHNIPKSKRNRRRRSFGKIPERILNDNLFSILSKFISKNKLVDFLRYLKSYTNSFFDNFKTEEEMNSTLKLSITQRIKRTLIDWIKPRIIRMVEKMNSKQIIAFTTGKYSIFRISNHVLFKRPLPDVQFDRTRDRLSHTILKSVFGGVLISSIKRYISKLSTESLIYMIEGKYNFISALRNGILGSVTTAPISKRQLYKSYR